MKRQWNLEDDYGYNGFGTSQSVYSPLRKAISKYNFNNIVFNYCIINYFTNIFFMYSGY